MTKLELMKMISDTIASEVPKYLYSHKEELLTINLYGIVNRMYNVDSNYEEMNLIHVTNPYVDWEEYLKFFAEQLVRAHILGVDIIINQWKLKSLCEVCFEEGYVEEYDKVFVGLLLFKEDDNTEYREFVKRHVDWSKATFKVETTEESKDVVESILDDLMNVDGVYVIKVRVD